MANREDEYKKLRSYLSKRIKGPNTDAILRSVASGPVHLINNIEAVNDSLYIVTAKEKFLDGRLGDKGVVRPANVGLSDEVFRDIGIEVTTRKQVRDQVHQLLRILYGEIYTRASASASELELYPLEDGDNLIVAFDGGGEINLVFTADQFQNIQAATAQEVADAITKTLRRLGESGAAIVQEDSGVEKVVLISTTDGPSSNVRVLGGSAQNVLKFPEIRPTGNESSTVWRFEQVDGGNIRATWLGGANPNLGKIKVGDYVNIFGSSFDPNNRGTFTVLVVQDGPLGQAYFEYENPNGVEETKAQGIADLSETFFLDFNTDGNFNATRSNGNAAPSLIENSPTVVGGELVLDDTLGVFVTYDSVYYEGNDNVDISNDFQIDFVMSLPYAGVPSSTNTIFSIGTQGSSNINEIRLQHFNRSGEPAFLLTMFDSTGTPVTSTSRVFNHVAGENFRVTITGDPLVGTKLFINGSSAGAGTETTGPFTVNNSLVDAIVIGSQLDATFRYGTANFDWFQIKNEIEYTSDFTASLDEPIGVFPNGDEAMLFYNPKLLTLTSQQRYAAAFQTSPRTLEVYLPATTKIVRRDRAGAAHIYEDGPSLEGQTGPYVYDPSGNFSLADEIAVTTEELDTNSDAILFVDDASDFPDDFGDLIIGLGTSHQEGPVPYISKPSNTTIRINPSYVFKNNHPIGTEISLLQSKTAAEPSKNGEDFPFYLTDSVAGRIYAEELIREITATGIVVIFYVLYPNDEGLGKWRDDENSEQFYIWGTEDDLIG